MRRGIGIVMSLLLCTLLLILGLGLASQSGMRNEAARRLHDEVAARAVAEAGLEDARVKLLKDPDMLDTLSSVSYSEVLPDADGNPFGRYTVTLDVSLRDTPLRLVVVTSAGDIGPAVGSRVRRVLQAELDVSATLRDDDAKPNPNYMRFLGLRDRGAWIDP